MKRFIYFIRGHLCPIVYLHRVHRLAVSLWLKVIRAMW